jgi:hypothetical protein
VHDPHALLRAGDEARVRLGRRHFELDLERLGELIGRRQDIGNER